MTHIFRLNRHLEVFPGVSAPFPQLLTILWYLLAESHGIML